MNHFDVKTKKKEREFLRKLRNPSFFTGTGRENMIVEVTTSTGA